MVSLAPLLVCWLELGSEAVPSFRLHELAHLVETHPQCLSFLFPTTKPKLDLIKIVRPSSNLDVSVGCNVCGLIGFQGELEVIFSRLLIIKSLAVTNRTIPFRFSLIHLKARGYIKTMSFGAILEAFRLAITSFVVMLEPLMISLHFLSF